MSTRILCSAFVVFTVAACSHVPQPFVAVPAPADSVAALQKTRQWTTVRIDGPYGAFDMPVPALTISPVAGSSVSLMLDSVALRQVERRLTTRIARVALDEAAALHNDSIASTSTPHQPAPAIQPGLLGAIAFEADSLTLSPDAATRIAAVAQMAVQLDAPLTLISEIDGTGAAPTDAAMMRARRVYLDLIAAQPALAGREVGIIVRAHAVLLGAARRSARVEVFCGPAR